MAEAQAAQADLADLADPEEQLEQLALEEHEQAAAAVAAVDMATKLPMVVIGIRSPIMETHFGLLLMIITIIQVVVVDMGLGTKVQPLLVPLFQGEVLEATEEL